MGDLTMLRNELVLGFVVAGFLAATVPNAAWSAIFLTHHGWLTTAENVLVAPLVAVASFVCSVGNIPLAAALWLKGVSFGGVVAFVFADLVTLPLLLIFRRFYGRAVALKLFVVLWFTMSVAGAVTEVIFRAVGATPRRGASVAMGSHFALGSTLVVNLLSLVVLTITYWISRGATSDDSVAIDPVCGMQVSRVSAAATVTHDGVTYYFCAPRCAERFSAAPTKFLSDPATMREDVNGDFVDPVCQMRVSAETAAGVVEGPDGPVYFCSLGCRDRYLAGPTAAPGTAVVQLGKKPRA